MTNFTIINPFDARQQRRGQSHAVPDDKEDDSLSDSIFEASNEEMISSGKK
jgi:hypothetical protein